MPHTKLTERPPVIAILGHIDHGKSTLLDYIRKTNIVEGEQGGITQHLSAYEFEHENKEGKKKRLTFLDTPGHEAFQKMRLRGAEVADIAILVVSAEDGVKAQTLEALEAIKNAAIPFLVAINKIDKPNANVDRTITGLSEHGIYLEGKGGDVPYVPISAKTGQGVEDLIDMLHLIADLEGLSYDPGAPAEGVVIEANRDPKRGISATLIMENGTLSVGTFVVAGTAVAPVRRIDNFLGVSVLSGIPSSPIQLVGFDTLPTPGSRFTTVPTKKEALRLTEVQKGPGSDTGATPEEGKESILLILKADVLGSIDAIEHELRKVENDRVCIRIIHKGVGDITESDIKASGGMAGAVALGFNVKVDARAKELAERQGTEVHTFSIIYDLAEWLSSFIEKRTPLRSVEEHTGKAKVLKVFNATKNKQVVGARILEGIIAKNDVVKIVRQDNEIARGKVLMLQQNKAEMNRVTEGEFGIQVECSLEIAPGDTIESFVMTKK